MVIQSACLSLAILLALMMPVNAERRAVEKPAPPDAPAAAPQAPEPVFLQLHDGSRLLGTVSIRSFPIQTSYAKMEIPFTLIDQIRFDDDHKTVTVSLRNGDRQQGGAEISEIEVQTLFGRHRIDVKHIVQIQVKNGRPDSTGPDVSNLDPPQRQEMAHTILNEARMLADALDQYALENNKQGPSAFAFSDLTPYLKGGSKLGKGGGNDSLGQSLLTAGTTIAAGIHVSAATQKALVDAVGATATERNQFWGPYS